MRAGGDHVHGSWWCLGTSSEQELKQLRFKHYGVEKVSQLSILNISLFYLTVENSQHTLRHK